MECGLPQVAEEEEELRNWWIANTYSSYQSHKDIESALATTNNTLSLQKDEPNISKSD
jgi:hypothetical protein